MLIFAFQFTSIMFQQKEIFSRIELLTGTETMDKISKTRVILFGVGGVGSWCAESLIRSGVGQLTIVDPDCVSPSNINRQLPATTETVGQAKVEVLKIRLQNINPHAKITAVQATYSRETNHLFQLDSYDYIIDAIDSLEHKTNLILHATQTNATFFSSMGAALKLDVSHIQTAEFWKVRGCTLAAALRNRFRKNTLPAKKFLCVFSDEMTVPSPWGVRKPRMNGSIVHITAIFGFTLAGLLIQDIVLKNKMFKLS